MISIQENLAGIRQRIVEAASRAGRDPDAVTLVAVSKKKPVTLIQEAVACGQLVFGENYLQESQEKIPALPSDIHWHFIGHIQSNKAKIVAELFDVVETVDRIKVARALEKHLAAIDKKMSVLIQVNIGREHQKSGVLPEDTAKLLEEIAGYEHLKVKGLMAMPPFFDDPEDVRPYFAEMRKLSEELQGKGVLGSGGAVELSMGMSGDFEVAIEEGATMVRVGTALFGQRL